MGKCLTTVETTNLKSQSHTHKSTFFLSGLVFLFVLSFTGCKLPSVPALPFLNQTASIDCVDLRIGVLIGDENDPIAQEQRDGYEMALQEINNNGGIAGCQIQVSYQTEATDGNSRQTYLAVRTLVEDEGVLAMIGGTSNQASMYVASLANYFSIPLMIPSAGGKHILPEDNRWAYQLSPDEDIYASQVFEMVKTTAGKGVNVAVVFEDSAFGNDAAIAAVNAINQNELNLVAYTAFDPTKTSYDQLVEQLITTNTQLVFIAFTSPEQAKNLVDAFNVEENYNFTILARSGGFSSHAFWETDTEGSASPFENILYATYFPPTAHLAEVESFTNTFARYIEENDLTYYSPTPYTAEAYKSMLILTETLDHILSDETGFKRSRVNVQDELRQALLEYKEQTVQWGNIDFSNNGHNSASVFILQEISDQLVIVYPTGKAQAEPSIELQPVIK